MCGGVAMPDCTGDAPGGTISPFMSRRQFTRAHILIIDDEPANVEVLRRLLERSGFTRIQTTTEPREATALYVEFRPDRKSTRLNSSHRNTSRMPSSA